MKPVHIILLLISLASCTKDELPASTQFSGTPKTLVVRRPDFTHRGALSVRSTITFDTVNMPKSSNIIWDFGDGVTSTAYNPKHEYRYSGEYTVTLTIGGDSEQTIAKKLPINVGAKRFAGTRHWKLVVGTMPPPDHHYTITKVVSDTVITMFAVNDSTLKFGYQHLVYSPQVSEFYFRPEGTTPGVDGLWFDKKTGTFTFRTLWTQSMWSIATYTSL